MGTVSATSASRCLGPQLEDGGCLCLVVDAGFQHGTELLAVVFLWGLPYSIVTGFQGQEFLEIEPHRGHIAFYDLTSRSLSSRLKGKGYRPELNHLRHIVRRVCGMGYIHSATERHAI